MEDILLAVQQAFNDKAAWFTAAGVKKPALIDFYLGQPEHPDEFEFTLPAVFMNYAVVWVLVGNVYEGAVTLSFHALPEMAPGTQSIDPRQSEGFKTITWNKLVRQTLDTVSGENFQRLIRAPENPSITEDFNYHVMDYTTVISEVPGNLVDKYAKGTIEKIDISGKVKAKFSV